MPSTKSSSSDETNTRPLVMYKLGGSLLEFPRVFDNLRSLWARRPAPERRLLIAGGGKAADLVRDWDRTFELGEDLSHDLAVRSLVLTEEFLLRQLPETVRITGKKQLEELTNDGQVGLLSVEPLLNEAHRSGCRVIKNWNFTTDSISACLGAYLGVSSLVLLKSTDPAPVRTFEDYQELGLLDAEISHYLDADQPFEWCNLRQSTLAEKISLTHRGG